MIKIPQELFDAYVLFYGKQAIRTELVTQAGSSRIYARFYAEFSSVLGVFNENVKENETFVYFSKVFSENGLNTPKVFYVSDNLRTYFVEDFGDQSLLSII